jgi:NAD-dependent deacetylase
MKKKLVILTGAGISAESGIKTFRDSDGLWENYRVEDVATYNAWIKNKQLVLDFYNDRHKKLENVKPNDAHIILAELEKDFDVQIITQNVDDLHERGGSTKVLHLHGELTKMRSSKTNEVYDWPYDMDLQVDSVASDGTELRPHIVWFGENVPNLYTAMDMVEEADIFVIIGTSMEVYPAAGLIDYVKDDIPLYLVNPENVYDGWRMLNHIKKVATEGVKDLKEILLKL